MQKVNAKPQTQARGSQIKPPEVGVHDRKIFTRALHRHFADADYREATNTLYEGLFGTQSNGLYERYGVPKKRDALPRDKQHLIAAAEYEISERLSNYTLLAWDEILQIIREVCAEYRRG
jgi:hypothetical protein